MTLETLYKLKAEHDRLETFIKNYNGKMTMKYEIDRLRELKKMIVEGCK